jgi:hypothetical protein
MKKYIAEIGAANKFTGKKQEWLEFVNAKTAIGAAKAARTKVAHRLTYGDLLTIDVRPCRADLQTKEV